MSATLFREAISLEEKVELLLGRFLSNDTLRHKMKKDIKIILVATLIYIVAASLATALFWVFIKTNTLSFIALLFTVWLFFIISRKSKDDSNERLQLLKSLWIQHLISEEEFQTLSSENPTQHKETTPNGFYHWVVILRFYFRNILKNNEKRLRNLEAYRVKEEILEDDYQAIRKTILRNL